ncbi:hypothetical protein [Cryptosporangium minutisporangium]|uniref:Uncharacterized protein n=1 Tax=Cryptosporangium minutisporangium TaxID=113569 RepID=A0ABP6SWW9_9ACTN
MDPSGVCPLPPAPPPSGLADVAARRLLAEDEVLASWLDLLIVDGLVPGFPAVGTPF